MNDGYVVDLDVLPGFLGVVLLLCLAPGPDMIYLVGAGITGGRGAATRGALGISLGVVICAITVAAGVGTAIAGHPLVLPGLQVAGCLYLLHLAATTVRDTRTGTPVTTAPDAPRHWFRRGLLVNLSNPKVLVFFVAFLPQFLGRATNSFLQLLLLGLLFQAVGVILDLVVGWSAGAVRDRVLARPRVLRALSYTSAAVFAALGALVGTEAVVGLTG